MLIDTHAHLDSVKDLKNVFDRAKNAGISKIITVSSSLSSSKKSIEIAQTYSNNKLDIYATCGIHPKDGKSEVEKFGLKQCIKKLKELIGSSGKVVGVGETGLDYNMTIDPSTSSGRLRQLTTDKEKIFQKELFSQQIKLASDLNLPIVIHCRDAWNEIFDLITKFQTPNSKLQKRGRSSKIRGVFHSFTGNWSAAQKAIDLGFYISFSGIVTYKNAENIQKAAQKMPLDRILIETDSPFLSPRPPSASAEGAAGQAEPFRRVLNEPKNVKIIAEFLASMHNLHPSEIAKIVMQNAKELFKV